MFDFFKKKKNTPSSDIHRETKEDFFRAILDPAAHKDNVKDETFRQLLEHLANQTPSDQFASGAVFDITRQQHDTYESVSWRIYRPRV